MRQWRESKSGEFLRKLAGLVKEIEAEAANIVKRFEEGERQAEIERQRWEEERRGAGRPGKRLNAGTSNRSGTAGMSCPRS